MAAEDGSLKVLRYPNNFREARRNSFFCKIFGFAAYSFQRMGAKPLFNRGELEEMAAKAHFDSNQLAVLCHISKRQLERKFQSTLSCSPQRWLNELRILKAQELLLAGNSIKETSNGLGYRHATYFYYQFKSVSGVTPKTFLLRAGQ